MTPEQIQNGLSEMVVKGYQLEVFVVVRQWGWRALALMHRQRFFGLNLSPEPKEGALQHSHDLALKGKKKERGLKSVSSKHKKMKSNSVTVVM